MSAVRGRPLAGKNDNAVTFVRPMCCRKSLTNSQRAVVKGGADRRISAFTMKLFALSLFSVCCTAR